MPEIPMRAASSVMWLVLPWTLAFGLSLGLSMAPAEVLDPLLTYALSFLLLSLALVGCAGRVTDAPRRHRWLALPVGLALLGAAVGWRLSLGGAVGLLDGWLAGLGLVIGGVTLGTTLGLRVKEPAWIWPLVIVALSADLYSALTPGAPTATLVQSGPQPGWLGFVLHLPWMAAQPMPLLGAGDVLFTGFLMGAVVAGDLSRRRAGLGLLAGFVACLIWLTVQVQPVPALPFIGPAAALMLGASIKPRPAEVALALAVAAGFAALGWWHSP